MAKKKLKNDGIFFVGKSAEEVTGSQYLIKFGNKQILIECGLNQSQSNDYLDSYKVNSEKFAFKPSEIDYVFVAHSHIDHCGLLPRLVSKGFKGKIITTEITAKIIEPLLKNSCAILKDEARVLSKRYGREYIPLYNDDDVEHTLKLIEVHNEYNTIIHLDGVVSFQWLKNSHCVGAAQLQLILNDSVKTRKILYTSDIGSISERNHYVGKTEIPQMFNDVSIMESTYGNPKRDNKKDREYDVEHLKSAVDTVLERGGTVILPCFSFSRTQELLTTLYEIYGDCKNFNAPVLVDSKLSCDISELYSKILNGDNLEKWERVTHWQNVEFISDKERSTEYVTNKTPKIVLSSSGFCTNGRVVSYLRNYLPAPKSMIIFTGYVGNNPSYLAYKIKNAQSNKYISVNGERILNKADCIALSTFSSHAGYQDLIKYGSSLNTNKLVLVHGSEESKKCLANGLEKAICENDKTYKVSISNKGMIVRL